MRSIFVVLFLLAITLDAGYAAVNVPEHLIDPGKPRIDDPDSLVHGYLDAVDRGELIVFGRRLDRSMITPTHVEYVYELSSRKTRVKIHSTLKEPMPVPDHPDCQVLSVSAVIDGGNIFEIESHVWIKQ
ncbi:MAG TPA: hypothetical protein VN283_05785 [Thiobacillus sp.]|nr:hypothetical protein [Thiobacillus sp.]